MAGAERRQAGAEATKRAALAAISGCLALAERMAQTFDGSGELWHCRMGGGLAEHMLAVRSQGVVVVSHATPLSTW